MEPIIRSTLWFDQPVQVMVVTLSTPQKNLVPRFNYSRNQHINKQLRILDLI